MSRSGAAVIRCVGARGGSPRVKTVFPWLFVRIEKNGAKTVVDRLPRQSSNHGKESFLASSTWLAVAWICGSRPLIRSPTRNMILHACGGLLIAKTVLDVPMQLSAWAARLGKRLVQEAAKKKKKRDEPRTFLSHAAATCVALGRQGCWRGRWGFRRRIDVAVSLQWCSHHAAWVAEFSLQTNQGPAAIRRKTVRSKAPYRCVGSSGTSRAGTNPKATSGGRQGHTPGHSPV